MDYGAPNGAKKLATSRPLQTSPKLRPLYKAVRQHRVLLWSSALGGMVIDDQSR